MTAENQPPAATSTNLSDFQPADVQSDEPATKTAQNGAQRLRNDRIIGRLRQLPALAAEATATRDHPLRPETPRTRRNKPDQAPPPTSIDYLAAMDPHHGLLAELHHAATTIATPNNHPPTPPTWPQTCHWLATNMPVWINETDKKTAVTSTIDNAWRTLRRLTGHQKTYKPHCPTDNKPLTYSHTDDVMICPYGHHWTIRDHIETLATNITMPTSELCDTIGITRTQLNNWARRGYLTPVSHSNGQRHWNITDATNCAHQHRDTPKQTTCKPHPEQLT